MVRRSLLVCAAGIGTLWAMAGTSHGAVVTIQNWSFEEPIGQAPTGWNGFPTGNGWYATQGNLGVLLNNSGTWAPSMLPSAVPNGNQVVALFPGNSFAQDISFLDAGSYSLSFYVGGRADDPPPSILGSLSYGVSLGGFTLYTGQTVSQEPFSQKMVTFTIETPGVYTLDFYAISPDGDRTAFFDAIEIQAIPEPSTIAIFGLGIGIVLLARRRVRA